MARAKAHEKLHASINAALFPGVVTSDAGLRALLARRGGTTERVLRELRQRDERATIAQLAAALGMDTRPGRAAVSSALCKLRDRGLVTRRRGVLAGVVGSYWYAAAS